jgi:hypothetical protein
MCYVMTAKTAVVNKQRHLKQSIICWAHVHIHRAQHPAIAGRFCLQGWHCCNLQLHAVVELVRFSCSHMQAAAQPCISC